MARNFKPLLSQALYHNLAELTVTYINLRRQDAHQF